VATSGGNQDLLFLLGDRALRSTDRVAQYFALQRRHPDGARWLEVGRFPTKEIAHVALDALVAHGHGQERDFHVKRVSLPG
jgi:hypothetical protein